MEQYILKEKIKEAIGNRNVQAALFYTFNFDPIFFENYVMPLLVPEKTFRDETIHNKILWRSCIKENLVPPIAVYCDYFAKDNTVAPSLGYDINCIKVPSAKGSICNFHPKHIFILLNDDTLLMITGSGNLTAGGWCENIECFSFEEIKKNKTFPNTKTKNVIQDIINKTNVLAKVPKRHVAEEMIFEFLKKVDFDFNFQYFNSLNNSFLDFIEDNIFKKDNIIELEIISPYYSNDTKLVDKLKSKGIKKIKCLIPTLRNNEIQLEKETFNLIEKRGIIWCFWENYNHKGKTYDRNAEVRNLHSKIYRFYGEKKIYTIISSVNFTNPAWGDFSYKNNKANIESAILYIENKNDVQHLLKIPKSFDINKFSFIPIESLENEESSSFFNRNPPEIEFIIDWKNKTLNIIGKKIIDCTFLNFWKGETIKNGEYNLDPIVFKILTKNSIIEITQLLNGNSIVHTYYPKQINIELKPLDFKLDANTILKYWEFLDDEFQKEVLSRIITEKVTDESGFVNENSIERKSLLNEMAAHFNGLIKLEKHLFPDSVALKKNSQEIRYYLLTENIDTIPFYLTDFRTKLSDGTILNSFYWMILQIVIINYYLKAEKLASHIFKDKIEASAFKKAIKQIKGSLLDEAELISKNIDITEAEKQWVSKQFTN